MDLLKSIPALPSPDGVHSQFDHPRSLASTLIAVNLTFLPLMIIAVGTRLYTRTFIANAVGWGDCKSGRIHRGMALTENQILVSAQL